MTATSGLGRDPALVDDIDRQVHDELAQLADRGREYLTRLGQFVSDRDAGRRQRRRDHVEASHEVSAAMPPVGPSHADLEAKRYPEGRPKPKVDPTPEELWQVVQDYERRAVWEHVRRTADLVKDVEVAEHYLRELPAVAALDALAASRQLVERIERGRWITVRDAREEGASWADIGEALGEGELDIKAWYAREIRVQETHVPEHHDTERGRAVLDDGGLTPS